MFRQFLLTSAESSFLGVKLLIHVSVFVDAFHVLL